MRTVMRRLRVRVRLIVDAYVSIIVIVIIIRLVSICCDVVTLYNHLTSVSSI